MMFKAYILKNGRKLLDAPLNQKGFLFWFFSPFLFLISFVVAGICWVKRKKGYASFQDLSLEIPHSLQVICIGNILMGGTGKSPIVRGYAAHYLEAGMIVGIAARGIGGTPVVVDSCNFIQKDIDKLSDENREHFEILRSKFPNKQFFIFQNKNRRYSLSQFIHIISKVQNKTCVFILDDGLQHFSCPRHVNICVSDSQLNQNSPHYAWPVGPYREGFGRDSISKLLASFDIRIWTNVVTRHDRGIQDSDVSYTLNFVQFQVIQNGQFEFKSIQPNNIILQKAASPLVIAGIAHPERFFRDLKSISSQFELSHFLALADHEQINENCLKHIEQSKIIILTLKDFFRFCTDQRFLELCKTRQVYGCYPEYKLLFESQKMDIK